MLTARGADEALPVARVVEVFEFASLLIVPFRIRPGLVTTTRGFSHTLLNPKLGYSTERMEVSSGLIIAVRNHTSTVTLAEGEEKC